MGFLLPFTKLLTPDVLGHRVFRHVARMSSSPVLLQTIKEERERRMREGGSMQKLSKSYAMNIFRGIVTPEQLFPYPDVLTTDQRDSVSALIPSIERFFQEVNDPVKNEENGMVLDSTMDGMKQLGLFGLQVPVEYNGLGLTNTQYARITDLVGRFDLGLGITVGAHQSIGFKGILLFGTEEQKKKYLPDLAEGKKIAAFALTEPTSGSDVSSIRTRGVLSDDRKSYILNGNKIWISNGGFADILTVFAKTMFTDPKTGLTKDAITAFIVERSFGGVSSSKPENKMGIKASNTTEVFFEDCKVPIENVIGNIGDGFKIAMQILNNGRFGMGSTLAGTMRTCISKAAEFASQRIQFGKAIEKFGVIQDKLGHMVMTQYATESIAYAVAANMDRGFDDYQMEAAISKIFASESAFKVCDEAIQIMGGMGYMKQTGLEKIMRDLRIFRIFEGTNDILRLFVALQGLQYEGQSLKFLQEAIKNPQGNLLILLNETAKRASRSVGIRYKCRALVPFVHSSMTTEACLTSEVIDEIGQTGELVLRKHAKTILDEQFILTRIAEAAIQAYSMSCVLSRATSSMEAHKDSADYEVMLAKAWCHEAALIARQNLLACTDPTSEEIFKMMTKICGATCTNSGVPTPNPVVHLI